MKNFFTIFIGFFISFASVASPHPLIDQGIEDLYSHSSTEQIKIIEQVVEALKTQAVQIVFLDQEGKCFTYHSISGDVSDCDTQGEDLVNNMLAKGVLLNNISEENDLSHLQSKGIIPIGQVAGLGEWICDSTIHRFLATFGIAIVTASLVPGGVVIAGVLGGTIGATFMIVTCWDSVKKEWEKGWEKGREKSNKEWEKIE